MNRTDTTPRTSPISDQPDPGSTEWRRSERPVPYAEAVAAMEARAAAIAAGRACEQVWLLEHPRVLTGGTSARAADLLDPGAIEVHRTGRGGQWTWHGPGQRIGYVSLDLSRPHGRVPARDLRAYVHALEAWLIAALAAFGVAGETRADRVGIWVVDQATGAENKIAAIGVRVTRWVTLHGVALNVAPDLADYARIVPCGIAAHGVTSLAALGVTTTLDAVDRQLRTAWDGVFGR